MPRKQRIKAYSTRVEDYPDTMSLYEIESLSAEATLAAEKKANQRKKKAKPSAKRARKTA